MIPVFEIKEFRGGFEIVLETPIDADKLIEILNDLKRRYPSAKIELDVSECQKKLVIDVME